MSSIALITLTLTSNSDVLTYMGGCPPSDVLVVTRLLMLQHGHEVTAVTGGMVRMLRLTVARADWSTTSTSLNIPARPPTEDHTGPHPHNKTTTIG